MIKNIPLSISGLILGLSGLSILTIPYSNMLSKISLIIATMLLLLIFLKFTIYNKIVLNELKKTVILSVFSTFPMALSIIALNSQNIIGSASTYFWYIAVFIHLLIIVRFTYKLKENLKVENIYASYYIVYVGIAIYSINSNEIGSKLLGKMFFYIAFIMALILLIIISKAYFKKSEQIKSLKPLITIYGAPFSLLLLSYIKCFKIHQTWIVMLLMLLSLSCYIFAIIRLIPLIIKSDFYPSYSAFTFPFVISAITYSNLSITYKKLIPIKYFSLVLAVFLTYFVLYQYIKYLLNLKEN